MSSGAEKRKRIHLRPRLQLAADYLGVRHTVADIGCDHGRLGAALLQTGCCQHVIASDISEDALHKARQLRDHLGLGDRMELRRGNGMEVLLPGEAEALVLAGMGGILMCEMLEACEQPLQGAKLAVFQPMRGQDDIRAYLFREGYIVERDGVVKDAGRLYQVFSARLPLPGETPVLPSGWPEDCFDLGYTALRCKDPLLGALAQQMLCQHEKNWKTAGGAGKAVLEKKIEDMRLVLALCDQEVSS